MTEVFVGLVTHPRSRFNADGSATRQAQSLSSALAAAGTATTLLVSDRDDYSAEAYPLTRADLLQSAGYAADLEFRWRRYLAAGGGRPARSAPLDHGLRIAMTVKRSLRAERSAAVRLLNIDLSHLRVMDAAAADGAPWTLVLEDDAQVVDVDACSDALRAVLAALEGTEAQLVSLSESLPLDRLGVEGLVAGSATPDAPPWLVAARRPVTNTVCANLYRTSLLTEVAAGIRRRGLVPVAPIDWRVNEQIMRLWASGALDGGSCAWARPGLFLQGSMHAAPAPGPRD